MQTISAAQAETFFPFEPAGKTIDDLETPVPVIDFDVMLKNLVRWQAHCDAVGVANRPHIKTHKLVPIAKLQLALGAKGICVQKLGEAEVMADAGIRDMLLTFNVVGKHKLERLSALMKRSEIAVVADNAEILDGLSQAGVAAGRKLDVLAECDTGSGRNGTQTPAETLSLAQKIASLPGLAFGGLMTYPPAFKRKEVAAFIAETKALLSKAGLPCPRVSSGGSRDLWDKTGLEDVTEYRAGTYIYNDRSLVAVKACDWADCAETVLTTVVSTPTRERAIIDAGTKSLTSDLLGLEGYGIVRDLGDAKVYNANEEHGYLDTRTAPRPLHIGETLRVVMNHTCPVNNLFDKVVFVRGNDVLGALTVDARGKVQ
ncbi:alanine racemase [Aestuariivirga sp.]|uniref:alanine racemase n=1 Tax=Aestuariivirga sp. TaxID=2650926 RepID=UPI0039E67F3B